jgi:CO/xanthine dehydrogenase Mo-binding subunit
MPETRIVGQPLSRIDAVEKVRGEAIFGADVQVAHALVGKFLPSPHAHAEILAIDISEAESLPGVWAVITAADIPKLDGYDPDSRFHAFLARRFAVFAGQPVAAVAAEDLPTAEAALERIKIEYRLLPVVSTPQQAILPGSPAVSRESRTGSRGAVDDRAAATAGQESNAAAEEKLSPNIARRHMFEHGDMTAAFADSDIIIEHTYTVPTVHQGYIEPHAVTAFWDRTDHVIVWECVQGAFWARDLIANTLGIPRTNITLNSTEIGGGFGGKAEGIFAPLAVLLAKKAQRPVKLVLTRREELIGANPAPHSIIRLKTGARRDGPLTALEGEVLADVGAFPSSHGAVEGIVEQLLVSYKYQAWRLEGLEVLTNKASTGAYRAPGAVNAAFAIESQLDEIASRLSLDPFALRRQNLILEGDLVVNMRPQAQFGAKEVLTALAGHPAWSDPRPPRLSDDGLLRGRGLGVGSWGSGRWPASAIAMLEADSKIRIVLGQVDLSGSFTSLAQIAAEALGVSVQQIALSKASSDYAPYAPVSGGSGTIYSMGAAVKHAALDLRTKLLQRAAEELQVTEAELAVNDAGVFVAARPEQSCSFQRLYELGTNIFSARYGSLIGQGSALPQQRAPTFAASVAEVAIDPATGKVTLTRLTIAQDVGKAINRLAVEGQLQGGAIQSVGIALWEEVLYDEQGQVRNASLLDYRMPTAADVPMIETILVEAPGGEGPYGAKGVGEPPIIPPVAAVANAVAAAIGHRIYDLPITPERVWRALNGDEE